MSSYLNVYLVEKESGENKLLESFGRGSEVYKTVDENNIAVYGKCKEVTAADMKEAVADVNKSIKSLSEMSEKERRTGEKVVSALVNACSESISKAAPSEYGAIVGAFAKEISDRVWDSEGEGGAERTEYEEDLEFAKKTFEKYYDMLTDMEGYSCGDYKGIAMEID